MKRDYRGVLTALLVASTAAGCYRYVPAEVTATPPGTRVQLLVTPTGAREAREAGALEDDGEPRVEGTVVDVERDDVLVRVPVGRQQDGFMVNRIDQSVRFPIEEIVSLRRRELDGTRTALVIGGTTLLGAGLLALIFDPFGRSDPDTEPPPDEFFTSLQILSVPIGR